MPTIIDTNCETFEKKFNEKLLNWSQSSMWKDCFCFFSHFDLTYRISLVTAITARHQFFSISRILGNSSCWLVAGAKRAIFTCEIFHLWKGGLKRKGKMSEIVELNVGGKLFMTQRSTFLRFKDSALAPLVHGKPDDKMSGGDGNDSKLQILMDENNRYFIDFDPLLFR